MKGREATTAHPLCTCREHDHQLDARHCIGPQFTYRRPDGSEYQGDCRIFGGIEPSTREQCVMHGNRRLGDDPAASDPAPNAPTEP